MKKILFLTNIPAPYRIDFFNALGRRCELTVLFEARRAAGIRFNWNEDSIRHFKAVFLSDGEINEQKVDRKVFRFLQSERFDCIIGTSYGYRTELAALLWLRLSGRPYYLELDGVTERAAENPIKRLLKRFLITGAQGVFSSSRRTDSAMLGYGARTGQLIRYPFTSLFQAEVLERAPSDAEKRRLRTGLGVKEAHMVLAVGQFIPRKGFDVLFDACDAFQSGAGVYIAGGKPGEDYLARTARITNANVHFIGFLDKERLAAYYRAADVLAFPTREDVWGLVVNEAMANALPVVTTDRCVAGTELVRDGENGYLIPIERADLLAERVNALLADGGALRDSMAASALETARQYTMEAMVDAHLRVLDGEKPAAMR